MPEFYEALVSALLCIYFLNSSPPGSLLVKNLWADATIAESTDHPEGSRAALGHVYPLESTCTALRGSSDAQTPLYPPPFATKLDDPKDPPIPIIKRGLTLVEVETHPRNVILRFKDNVSKDCWCQVQLLKHTVAQAFSKKDWDEAVCKVNRADRGFKVGLAFEFEDYVLAFLTLDLLIQFHWSGDRASLASQPDVYLNFPQFLDDLVKWTTKRRGQQTDRSGNAMTAVRTSTEIFAGAGVYTIPELWHMAGLAPNLTEAEVFDSPSRTARLCAAYYHFGKEAHTTLWPLVKRFLVGFVICVSEEDRLLYSDRLNVHGKDRSYVSARFHELLSDLELCFDATRSLAHFEPELIRHALEIEDMNLGTLIFGADHWAYLCADAGFPAACVSSWNPLAHYYSTLSLPSEMASSWLNMDKYTYLFHPSSQRKPLQAFHPHTRLYRLAKADIWSVIPAFPDNSAPIPRRRPPLNPREPKPEVESSSPPPIPVKPPPPAKRGKGKPRAPRQTKSKPKPKPKPQPKRSPPKPKPLPPLIPKPTPIELSTSFVRDRTLLSYIIKYTQDYTVGPLDYCGIARRIKGRGEDVILYCQCDPRVTEFYLRRHALSIATAKLKAKGVEKEGLGSKVLGAVEGKVAKVAMARDKENLPAPKMPPKNKKKRHSADRDLAEVGLVLSPRKRRRVVVN
ncbi:hypothetical protein R3P38DRAFT_3480764 [Favolaschia claudopus]|uniref:Uncharacterized protein n=1 Tax=Favolaschia claudopus TaxID=2862362 RepID=A0AAW0CD49_9AGAR